MLWGACEIESVNAYVLLRLESEIRYQNRSPILLYPAQLVRGTSFRAHDPPRAGKRPGPGRLAWDVGCESFQKGCSTKPAGSSIPKSVITTQRYRNSIPGGPAMKTRNAGYAWAIAWAIM